MTLAMTENNAKPVVVAICQDKEENLGHLAGCFILPNASSWYEQTHTGLHGQKKRVVRCTKKDA